jgi:AcrR family transcriptional regulator
MELLDKRASRAPRAGWTSGIVARVKLRRRVARQSRSRETTDAIVEAAAQVFAEVGLERATTTRIAEVAGVSVGSLYQYFPDKRSLITAIYERESRRLEDGFIALVEERGIDDVAPVVRAFVETMLETFEKNASLYAVLIDEVPRVEGLESSRVIDHAVARRLRLLLELGRHRIAPKDLEFASLLLVRTFRYNTIPMLREPLAPDRRAAYVDELTTLLCAYLFAPPHRWRGDRTD